MAAKKTVKKASKPKIIKAVEAYEIYADYDAEAPDSDGLFTVDDKSVADGLCEHLNKNPRGWRMAYVQGYEWCKRFRVSEVLVPVEEAKKYHYGNVDDAIAALIEEVGYDGNARD